MCLPQNVHLVQNYLSWLCETAECLSHLLGHLSWDSAECRFTSTSYREFPHQSVELGVSVGSPECVDE